jgi:hypothetical protein
MHAVLPDEDSSSEESLADRRHGILVIGDIHGCYDEMLLLYEKALKMNKGRPFRYVITVGDLCNKGPKSVQVIRHVRNNNENNWLSVRGNHDNSALKAALGDPMQAGKEKYQWVHDLSDEDVEWMSELPYTIRIPGTMMGKDVDTLIVHAGLLPGVHNLEEQSIETMITIREVEAKETDDGKYQYYCSGNGGDNKKPRYAWASVWKGPERIIFGHDARRGLQLNDWATGLDTGACYGKKLTAIILPECKFIFVDALEAYCPISKS